MNGPWQVVPHGADLARAQLVHGEPPQGWLDLSTGINPRGWPAQRNAVLLSEAVWRDLPAASTAMIDAFERYYGSGAKPVAGSQAVIQALPRVWRLSRGQAVVNVLAPGYGEHAARWLLEGHDVRCLPAERLDAPGAHVIVVAQPNNPTGEHFAQSHLRRLAQRCELLVIDAAFGDVLPAGSLLDVADNVMVLRSLGKFFGLGGLRVGTVLAPQWLQHALDAELGPWAVNGPGLHLAAIALSDECWQRETHAWLLRQSAALSELLLRHGWLSTGTALFRTVETPHALALHEALARAGVWTRCFQLERPVPYRAVRFGLPADDAGLHRLDAALRNAKKEIR